jgi:hypothetical protein
MGILCACFENKRKARADIRLGVMQFEQMHTSVCLIRDKK